MNEPQKSKSREGRPANAHTETDDCIIGEWGIDRKTLDTLAAQFALLGHEMRVTVNTDGRCLIAVSRWGQSRVFAHLHDVRAFLTQVGGAGV